MQTLDTGMLESGWLLFKVIYSQEDSQSLLVVKGQKEFPE